MKSKKKPQHAQSILNFTLIPDFSFSEGLTAKDAFAICVDPRLSAAQLS